MEAPKRSKPARRHQWGGNPRFGDENARIPSAKLLPLFQQLVSRAKRQQHGWLTEAQYKKLEAEFMKARYPIGSPMAGLYYENRAMLRKAMLDEGVTVRPENAPKLHRFQLHKTGISRLSEIERKISSRK